MTLVIDTQAIAAEDRLDAAHAAFAKSTIPMKVSFGCPSPSVLLEAWALGRARAIRVTAQDFSVERADCRMAADQLELVAVGVLLSGSGRLRAGGQSVPLTVGEIKVIDLSSAYACWWSGAGQALSLNIASEELGVSPDVIGRASSRLTASPLYGVVADHVRRLAHNIHRLAADPDGSAVTSATVQLVRALIASSIRDERDCRAATSEALWPLIVAYVDAHLTEHNLSPARIAAVHNISQRYLYKLAASHDLRLSEWIIGRRLLGAREELQGSTGRTIAATARRWGFTDPAHFSRRFRQEFGMSPRECRVLACGPSPARDGAIS